MKLCVTPGYESALQHAGLETLEKVAAYQGELHKTQRGNRDVFRVTVTGPNGTPTTLYIKRNWRAKTGDGWRALLTHGSIWSKSRVEFDNYLKLRRAGIATPTPVAYGEIRGWFKEKFSCLITEQCPGRPLDERLAAASSESDRRQLLEQLARFLRNMHDKGISFPDIYAAHVFVIDSDRDSTANFALIDVARLYVRAEPVSERLRIRDVAALDASIPPEAASDALREQFLTDYAGGPDQARRLGAGVRRRVAKLLRRERFKRFNRAV